jgi:CRISPR-associated Csx11 family protein
MSSQSCLGRLRDYRSFLLTMEVIGWLHMAGKADVRFLFDHGGIQTGYKYENWFQESLYRSFKSKFDSESSSSCELDTLFAPLKCITDTYKKDPNEKRLPKEAWPARIDEFFTEHRKQSSGLLGLLQAAHGMVSGIEKNVPRETARYLQQDVTHMWLSSAFGFPERNLLVDEPPILHEHGRKEILREVEAILRWLQQHSTKGANNTADEWWKWREEVRQRLQTIFTQTLAETRLPNNDVTLWDQSYVTAALFKSAVAGALLEQEFPWNCQELKRVTRWRLLTVAMNVDHYENRAVRIGDWTGARAEIDEFFTEARKMIEVELAIGSLLYRDTGIMVFSFPGERFDSKYQLPIDDWQSCILRGLDELAQERKLETPPYCAIGGPTRSLVSMAAEIERARKQVAVPIFRDWAIHGSNAASGGHVCPICLIRRNGKPDDKQRPCKVCGERRENRLDKWLNGSNQDFPDTIWINEVADENNRLALITVSLDLEPWTNGKRLDAFRTQAIYECLRHNPELCDPKSDPNSKEPYLSMFRYAKKRISGGEYCKKDSVLKRLHGGYAYEKSWPDFYAKIVEDRSDDAPPWDKLDNEQRAKWVVHQIFCKLPSPGRIYRFWRQAEGFFEEELAKFKEIVSRHSNRWRVRRLSITPKEDPNVGWEDYMSYEGDWHGSSIDLLYVKGSFVTTCNLARLLKSEKVKEAIKKKQGKIELFDDKGRSRTLEIENVEKATGQGIGPLGVYSPLIPLEVSPARFRVLVPLATAAECVDRLIVDWEERFARVWGRLPMLVGVVAFPRKLSLQAVIEASRNLEDELDSHSKEEKWQVEKAQLENANAILFLRQAGTGQTLQCTIPLTLPDGRLDVFYPYFAVEDTEVRHVLDFRHPNGQVYRHVSDLKPHDIVSLTPPRIATLFMDTAAKRFEIPQPRLFTDWSAMRCLWSTVASAAESMASLRFVWDELKRSRESWIASRTNEEGLHVWQAFSRTVISKHLGLSGADLEQVVEAARSGLFEWCLDWHISVLGEGISAGYGGGRR